MQEEIISPLFFEKILIKFLFNDIDVREKIIPFLDTEIFDAFETKDIIKLILDFVEEYSKFPTIPELKLKFKNKDSFDCLIECLNIDLGDYDKDFILEEIQDFFKRKMILNEFANGASKLKEENLSVLNDIPDKIREKLSFSFDTDVGSNVFSEKGREEFWDFLHRKDRTFSTGISYVDRILDGGFCEKTLNLFLSPSGVGKTLILCSLTANHILQNRKVLYITLEMSEKKIERRIIANLFDVELNNLKKMKRDEFDKKFDQINKKIKDKLIVKEYPAKSLNANRIRNLLKELKVKCKFEPEIIVIDYLGLLTLNNSKKNSNSYEVLKEISEETRAIGQEFGQAMLSAIQTNREGFGLAALNLTNVADSIGIIATADVVIGVTCPPEYAEDGKYCWQFLKNRDNVGGISVNIGVDKPKMRIYADEAEEEKYSKDFSNVKKPVNKVEEAASDIVQGFKNDRKTKRNDFYSDEIEM